MEARPVPIELLPRTGKQRGIMWQKFFSFVEPFAFSSG